MILRVGSLTKRQFCYKVIFMSYVFFDLEWNQGYPHNEEDKLDEIIQIGACRLQDWAEEPAPFSAYIRPAIHKKLHHRVRKMLPLKVETLRRAEGFRVVAGRFFRWCGPDPVFFTWGNSDVRVLDMNLCWYGMEEYLELEIYDLQRAFDLMVLRTDQQTSLKDAVDALQLGGDLTYHDAGNDALYTARIGAELVGRFGKLPSVAELDRMEAELRRERREAAAALAEETLRQVLEEKVPVYHRPCGVYKTTMDCLKSRNARIVRCPKCESWLCNGNWLQIQGHFVARSRCLEHGRFYTCITVQKSTLGAKGMMDLFTPEEFTPELFRQCKAGGAQIAIGKGLKKRKRVRRKRKVKVVARSEESASKR